MRYKTLNKLIPKRIVIFFVSLFMMSGCLSLHQPSPGLKASDIEKSLKPLPAGSYPFKNPLARKNDPDSIWVSFHGVYMCNHEVSNAEYLMYLDDIKSKPYLYNYMLPDTEVWNRPDTYFPAYVNDYLRNPAFANYPVVGISSMQAEAYCDWLTKAYSRCTKRKFKMVEFSLPGYYTWIHAAGSSLFPWDGKELKNKDGSWRANFYAYPNVTDEQLKPGEHVEARTLKNGFTDSIPLAQVLSYKPNAYGLYNMGGNVEEYVSLIDATSPPRLQVALGEPEFKTKTCYSKGGSWNAPAYYLQNAVMKTLDSLPESSAERGFRYVMWVGNYGR